MQGDKNYKAVYVDDNEDGDDTNLRELFDQYKYHYKWFICNISFTIY